MSVEATGDYGADFLPAREKVLRLLWDLQWHDAKELEGVGGNRFGARLLELRRLGYQVINEQHVEGKHGKRYRLKGRYPEKPQEKRVKVLLPVEAALEVMRLTRSVASKEAQQAYELLKGAVASFQKNRDKL